MNIKLPEEYSFIFKVADIPNILMQMESNHNKAKKVSIAKIYTFSPYRSFNDSSDDSNNTPNTIKVNKDIKEEAEKKQIADNKNKAEINEEILNAIQNSRQFELKRLLNACANTDLPHKLLNFSNQNILSVACNTSYQTMQKKADSIFWCIINVYKDRLELLNVRDIFGRSPIAQCVYNRHAHYFYALLNYGMRLTNSDLANAHVLALRCKNSSHKSNVMISFVTTYVDSVMESVYPPGSKLLSLGNVCSLSKKELKRPVIIEDGTVYEYDVYAEYVSRHGLRSPVSGAIVSKYVYLFMEDFFERW